MNRVICINSSTLLNMELLGAIYLLACLFQLVFVCLFVFLRTVPNIEWVLNECFHSELMIFLKER